MAEVGEALTGNNIEDRRDEFSTWQQLLMSLGVKPVDHNPYSQILPPGGYLTDDLDPRDARLTPLGKDAGYLDLQPKRKPNGTR